jgi:hypothetical protein
VDPRHGFSRREWPIFVGLPLLVGVVLLIGIDHDPARGVTFSNSPFSDEAWRAVNARNLVLLGSWTTDDWTMHLVQWPLSVVQAAVFAVAGVGLVQARLISIAATMAMAAVLLVGLRRPLGLSGAVAAAAGASFSVLTLYYGRLALLEPTVALALSVAAISSVRADQRTILRWAVVCGIAMSLAISLKVNALPSAIGILLAVAILSVREIALRRFLAITIVMIGVVGVGWVVAVAIPQAGAVRDAISILPATAIPSQVDEWLRLVARFIRSNDGVTWQALPLLLGALAGLVLAIDRGRFARPGRNPMSGPARVALVGVLWVGLGFLGVASFDYQPNRYVVPILPGLALIVGSGVAVVVERAAPRGPRIQGAIVAIVLPLLCLPGLIAVVDWGTRTGPGAIQGQTAVERILPDGVTLAGGYAPLFAMRLPITTLILYPDTPLNSGDLYGRGVRWGVVEDGPAPPWVAGHADAWAARIEHWCAPWGRDAVKVCLVELP